MSAITQENTFQGERGGRGGVYSMESCMSHACPYQPPIYVLAQHCMKRKHFYPYQHLFSYSFCIQDSTSCPAKENMLTNTHFDQYQMEKTGKRCKPQLAMNWQHTQKHLGLNKCRPCMQSPKHYNSKPCSFQTSQKNTEVNFWKKNTASVFDLPTEYPSQLLKNSIASSVFSLPKEYLSKLLEQEHCLSRFWPLNRIPE